MRNGVPWMALLGSLAALGTATVRGAPDDDPVGPPAPVTTPSPSAVPSDPWSSPDVAAPHLEGRPLPRRRDADRPAATSAETAGSRGSPWLRTTGSLAAVVGLILLLAWGYRLVAGRGRLHLGGRRTGLIEVVGRTTLSPRQSLCLVRLGPRLVLLGVTPDAVRALDVIQDADLTARLMGQAAQRRPDSQTAEFARCLERESKGYTSEDGDADRSAPEEARLTDVRRTADGVEGRVHVDMREASFV